MKLNSAIQRGGPEALRKAEKIIKEMHWKKYLQFIAGLKRSVRKVA